MGKRKWTVVLLAGLVAIILVPGAWHLHRAQQEKRDIDQRYTTFHDVMAHGRTADAYAIMSPAYRAKHDLGEFERDLDAAGEGWLELAPGRSLRLRGGRAWLYPQDSGFLELWCGPEYEWVKVDGQWYLSGESEYYYD